AEDGIRDRNVTGVQTCALPISRAAPAPGVSSVVRAEPRRGSCTHGAPGELAAPVAHGRGARPGVLGSPALVQRGPGPARLRLARSEERRVGGGRGAGWTRRMWG